MQKTHCESGAVPGEAALGLYGEGQSCGARGREGPTDADLEGQWFSRVLVALRGAFAAAERASEGVIDDNAVTLTLPSPEAERLFTQHLSAGGRKA